MKMPIDRDRLYRMYVKNDMSIVTIAYFLKVHSKTVSMALEMYGIPKRKHGSIDHLWRVYGPSK